MQGIIYKNIDGLIKPYLIPVLPKERVYPEWFDSFSFKIADNQELMECVKKALVIVNKEDALSYIDESPVINKIYRCNIVWDYFKNDLNSVVIMKKFEDLEDSLYWFKTINHNNY
jgi:hypothetical protein